MLTNIKPKILISTSKNQIKLIRRRISDKQIYELSVADFFRLVDSLSKGGFISFVSYYVNNNSYVINERVTMLKMMKYILNRLDKKHIKQLFGEDSSINTIEDFIILLSKSKWYTVQNVNRCLNDYINSNFYFINGNFIRKTNKRG